MSASHELHVVVFQELPGMWAVRGLEHDIMAEARSIGEALRAIVNVVRAHTQFDYRHNRPPLSAFHPAPPSCWNAFASGTTVPLAQLGIETPDPWEIVAAIAVRRPQPAPAWREVALRAAV